MPNYNYFPATYQNPYPYSYQPYQQPTPMPQPQQQQPQQNSLIWVANEKDAAMYPLAPNTAIALWSQAEPVVFLKQADASGKPSMKVFDLVERSDASKPVTHEEYATKADLTAVASAMKEFDNVIGLLRSDVDSMKGDIYGIAGKKKPAVRKVDDDVE